MKNKIVYLMSMLLTQGLFCACNNDDDSDVLCSIKQIEIDSATEDFLNQELPVSSYVHCSYGFFQELHSDTCFIINSYEELLNIYDERDSPLPELIIDFEKKTLVVGQFRITEQNVLPVKLERQFMCEKKDCYILNVYYQKKRNSVDLGIFKLAYYWGVYPKLNNKKLIVNLNWFE